MKKHFYILASLLLIAILVFLFLWLRKDRVNDDLTNAPLNSINSEVIIPVFMTDAEKTDHGLSVNSQVQVLGRNKNGVIMSYKIIRSDDDLITNRKQLQIR